MRYLTILFLIIALSVPGCSEKPESRFSAPYSETNDLTGVNPGPISISPDNAVKGSILYVRIDNSIGSIDQYQWFINGIRDESRQNNSLDTTPLNKNDIVHVVVVRGNHEFSSNNIVIGNSPPSIVRSRIVPEYPTASSTMTVNVKGEDNDNDRVNFIYKWFLNDEYSGDASYLEADMKRDDEVKVEITPNDGESSGKTVILKKTILNSLPVVNEGSPVINGSNYRYQVNAADPDGDTLSFTLAKGPEGMSVDQSGVLTWEIKPDSSGDHDIEVLISDNQGAEIIVPFTTMIGFE